MIAATIAAAVSVFARAIQQLNVVHHLYLYAFCTAYLIAAADVMVIVSVVSGGWHVAPFVGTGGAVGVVVAMWLHQKIRRRNG